MKEKQKHEMRIRDIITNSQGDSRRKTTLAVTQANRIMDKDKAQDRAAIAEEMGYADIANIFNHRYKQLTQTRSDKLSILLDEDFFQS